MRFTESTPFECPRCKASVKKSFDECPECGLGLGVDSNGIVDISEELDEIFTPKAIDDLMLDEENEKEEELDRIAPPPSAGLHERAMERALERAAHRIPPPERKREPPKKKEPKPKAAPKARAPPKRKPSRGRVNGTKSGMINGTRVGLTNGTRQGLTNGTRQGLTNGTRGGFTNGTRQGMTNGLKRGEGAPERPVPGAIHETRSPRMAVAAIAVVLILLFASVLTFFVLFPASESNRIRIDGDFSDWEDVPPYELSALFPGEGFGMDEVKLAQSGRLTYIYFDIDEQAIAAVGISAFYVFMDMDSDRSTGYDVGCRLGADRTAFFEYDNGTLTANSLNEFSSTADHDNWTAWSQVPGLRSEADLDKVESVIDSPTQLQRLPTLQVVYARGLVQGCSPLLSNGGTLMVEQRPIVDGGVASGASAPVLNVSLLALGNASSGTSISLELVDADGQHQHAGNFTLSPNVWMYADLTANLTGLSPGDAFSFEVYVNCDSYEGAVDVCGEPARGYYQTIPSGLRVDGLFSDWANKTLDDTDALPIGNPNIDIKGMGAATQSSNHFFYVDFAGKALGGADVPEQRVKYHPGEPGSPVKLRRTGEDMLQAFIDADPTDFNGTLVTHDGVQILADYLVEVTGRNGEVASQAVYAWSEADELWEAIGSADAVEAASSGIELSVAKGLLGNLSGATVTYFSTDWRSRFDGASGFLGLSDPWAITGSGLDYRSYDGRYWTAGGTIPLTPGDTLVDGSVSVSRLYVYVVTNSGRTYRWEEGKVPAWSANKANPINGSANVVAITPYHDDKAFILTADGRIFQKVTFNAGGAGSWSYVKTIGPYTDFTDLVYRSLSKKTGAVTMYALRSTTTTTLYLTTDGGKTWTTAGTAIGSTSPQVEMMVIAGTAPASDRILVLSELGGIRYSANGGSTWSSIGNLPAPGTGNTSRYTSISIDQAGVIWVGTDSGYCFKSTDGGNTFIYTGLVPGGIIISITTPIPEGEIFLLVGAAATVFVFSRKWKKRQADQSDSSSSS